MLKKVKLILVFLLISICCISENNRVVLAESESIESEFNQTVENQLYALDFSVIERVLENATENSQNIFGSSSFFEKVSMLINGEISNDFGSVLELIFKVFFDNILEILPTLCLIIAIAILFSLISNLKSSSSGGVKDIVHFVAYGVIIIIVSSIVSECVINSTNTLQSIQTQMEVIFPILITLITAVGGVTSASVFQPSVILLSNGIMQLFNYVLLPLFLIAFIFTIANNLSSSSHFSKFIDTSQSIFKWIIGIVFSLFIAYLTINSIVAGSFDGISIKTAKYTMKSYVPYIGGYMGDGFDIVISSSVLIKNAVGACGLILLLATTLLPLIKLMLVIFGLKITGAVLEPITDKRISSFVYSVGKVLNMLIACLISVSIMYFLCVGLLMSVCNLF